MCVSVLVDHKKQQFGHSNGELDCNVAERKCHTLISDSWHLKRAYILKYDTLVYLVYISGLAEECPSAQKAEVGFTACLHAQVEINLYFDWNPESGLSLD